MRIAFISPFVYKLKRGIEKFTTQLSNKLVEFNKNLEVTILTWQEKRPRWIDRLHDRVKICMVPYVRYYRSKAAIPFYVFNFLKWRYDIVNIFFAGYGESEALAFLSLVKRQQFNIIFQYPYSQAPHRYMEFNRFNIIHDSDRIISPSKFVAEGVKEFCGRESDIIYNGFDRDAFYPDDELRRKTRSELGFSESDKVILTIAAFEERKGIQKVIKAMPLLNKKIKNVKYVILGTGPFEPQLKNIVKNLNLDRQVIFAGVKNNPLPFYCMADLFLLLSYGEGMPLVILSAMGCQLPVIVSNRRPFDEIVKEGTGCLIDDENPEDVSATIANLLLNDDLRKQIGRRARSYAVDNFCINKTAREYMRLFESQLR